MNPEFHHYLITRFNVHIKSMLTRQLDAIDIARDERYLNTRFRLFEEYTLPSVFNQTCRDFKWLVLFSANTPDIFRVRIMKYKSEWSGFIPLFIKDNENYDEIIKKTILENKTGFCITSRVDNDDALAINYIEEVQKYFIYHEGESYALVFCDGCQYEEKTKVLSKYYFPTNHFSSLIEPYGEHVRTIMSFNHMNIADSVCVKKIRTNDTMWLEVVHDTNVSNRMHFNKNTIINDVTVMHRFGIYGKRTCSRGQACTRAIVLFPSNCIRLIHQYGFVKIVLKILEKLRDK